MNKSLVNTALAVVFATQVAGCATNRTDFLPRQAVTVDPSVTNTAAVMTPCDREGIKLRPANEVTRSEYARRQASGEVGYFHAGYYMFAEKSIVEKWAPIAGAVIGGALGSQIGTGGVRIATTAAGAAGGAYGGAILAKREKLERLAAESGCEAFAEAHAPRSSGRPNPGVDEGRYGRGYRSGVNPYSNYGY